MDLHLISPVKLDEVQSENRRKRYSEAFGEKNITLRPVKSVENLPSRFNSKQDIDLVSKTFAQDLTENVEAVADCMLDPGVEFINNKSRVGLFGQISKILRESGQQYIPIARNKAMRDRVKFLIDFYQVEDVYSEVISLDIPAENAFESAAWASSLKEFRSRTNTNLEALACCTGIHFAPSVQQELSILTPYDVLRKSL